LARIALGSARPRDLTGLRETLALLPALREKLASAQLAVTPEPAPLLQQVAAELGEHPAVLDLLTRAILAQPPVLIRDGGVIAPAYDAELDELRALSTNADQFLLDFENRERTRTGVMTLKVGYNRVHGYYIELGRAKAEQVPSDYQRRQTLKGVERYITPELKSFEDKVLSSRERALAREKMLYEAVLAQVTAALLPLQTTATALATLDVLTNLAERAATLHWNCPELTAARQVEIVAGRHPVVERVLDMPFVANDLRLDAAQRMLIVTGPNMGGKCLAAHTLIFTSRGLMSLAALKPQGAPEHDFVSLSEKVIVKSVHTQQTATHFYSGGIQKTIKIITGYGFSLEGTAAHKIRIKLENGDEQWCCLGDLHGGEVVMIDRSLNLWGTTVAIPALRKMRTLKKQYPLPKNLSGDLAYLIGLLVGAGSLTDKNYLEFTHVNRELTHTFTKMCADLLHYAVVATAQNRYRLRSLHLRMFFAQLGLDHGTARHQKVPEIILSAPKEIVMAFLQGLFDTNGTIDQRFSTVEFSTASDQMATQIQLVLLNFGIIAALRTQKTNCPPNYMISLDAENAVLFHQRVGSRLTRNKEHADLAGSELKLFNANNYFYDRIVSLTAQNAEVFDLSVTQESAYIANGFVSHNSTYMRQNALIVILAYSGSFVPAQSALIGPIDRIFSRIGASDDLAGGRSTFMVEMEETANILNNATAQSLVLMDEIGRGTSTFDGLSLAWACAVELATQIGALSLFATHYFELTQLADAHSGIANVHLDAVEHGHSIVFLHRVHAGAASQSYGLAVAALAGVPRVVIERARARLRDLEASARRQAQHELPQLPLFAAAAPESAPPPEPETPLDVALRELNPDELTPRDALAVLYRLRALFNDKTQSF
jgi:DNA mismatch repair protein MutS